MTRERIPDPAPGGPEFIEYPSVKVFPRQILPKVSRSRRVIC